MTKSCIDVVAVIEEGISSSLKQKIEATTFNWKVESENCLLSRIELISSPEQFKALSDQVKEFGLQMIVLITADDRSYIEYLKFMPKNSKILVYLDNKNLADKLLINPSVELYSSWSDIALDGSQNNTSQYAFSSSDEINKSVREEFTHWLGRIKEKDQLVNKLCRLDKTDFYEVKGGALIHKECPLISHENERWYGTPNPKIGFWSNVVSFETIGEFRLMAAAGQNLKEWYESDIPLPDFNIVLERPSGCTDRVTVEFQPKDDSAEALALFKNVFEPLFQKRHDFVSKLKLCIRLNERVLLESLEGEDEAFDIMPSIDAAGGDFKVISEVSNEDVGKELFSITVELRTDEP